MLKRKFSKLLILIVVSMLMFNFIGTNVVMASASLYAEPVFTVATSSTDASSNSANKQLQTNSIELNKEEEEVAKKMDVSTIGGVAVDGIVGILTYLERFKLIIFGGVCQFLATVVATSAGETESITMVSPEDILFNKLAITDINFFNINTFGSTNKNLDGANNPIKLLKENVAKWYMTLRTIAIIILLVILIYIGIRMAMTSVASEKAAYKKMLMNWVVSLALVFLLHYIIVFAIHINNAFVNILSGIQGKALPDNKWGDYLQQMVLQSFVPLATISWSSAILYLAVVALTFVFLIMYIKRMITIAFLILVSPIITITYSIDKLGDGKAQAFSAWLKEFLHNVFIQPFHCLIYLAFTSVAFKMLGADMTLASTVLAILTMFFILQAEKLIKKIFGIDSESTGNAMATAAVLSTAYGKFSKVKQNAPTNNAKGATPPATKIPKSNVDSVSAKKNMNAVTPDYSTNERFAQMEYSYYDDRSSVASKQQAPSKQQYFDHAPSNDRWAQMEYEQYNDETYASPKVQATDVKKNNVDVQQQGANAQQEKVKSDLANTDKEKQQEKSLKQKAWNGVKSGFKFVKDHQIHGGLAGGVIGGTLAGMAGANMAETIGSIGVGKKAQEAIEANSVTLMKEKKQKWENYLKNTNETRLAREFKQYKNGKAYDNNSDIQRTRELLKMKPDEVENISNKSEQNYVRSLHATRDLYKKMYPEEDANEKAVETMEKVINREIEPKD